MVKQEFRVFFFWVESVSFYLYREHCLRINQETSEARVLIVPSCHGARPKIYTNRNAIRVALQHIVLFKMLVAEKAKANHVLKSVHENLKANRPFVVG
jgi:hypothetical protein